MTTNKPEVVGYASAEQLRHFQEWGGHLPRLMEEQTPTTVPLIRLSDYEALQAELADMERDYLVIIEAQDAEHRKQLARLQAECDKLRAAIRRLCNIYVVDDYYDGQLREERLDRAVNRAINAAIQETNP